MTRVGRYRTVRKIASGAYGDVYEAVADEGGERVAIKILERRGDIGSSFKREVASLRYLRHPGIVRLVEVLASPSRLFVVCEYAAGGDLYGRIDASPRGRLTESEALPVFLQILDAIVYCHARGICHRDLKPENVLLTEDGRVKVADFGFSRAFMGAAGLVTECGSPHYVAPEVLGGLAYDGTRADCFSLGVILFVSIAGVFPFCATSREANVAQVREGPPAFEASEGTQTAVRMLTRLEPAERWTAEEARVELGGGEESGEARGRGDEAGNVMR